MSIDSLLDSDASTNRPFELFEVHGFNPHIPIINLTESPSATGANYTILGLVTANVITLHKCIATNARGTATTQHLIGGHTDCIHTLRSDAKGRFLLSAASDSCCVWDRQLLVNDTPAIIRHLRAPFGPGGNVRLATLSADGRYIIVIGHSAGDADTELIQFWLWSAGAEKPDCERTLPVKKFGKAKSVTFNPFNTVLGSEFVVTMAKMVLFGRWLSADPEQLRVRRPGQAKTLESVEYCATVFCEMKRHACTISNDGSCTLWTAKLGSYIYKATKSYRIGSVALVDISYVDEMVVVLSSDGRMRFFNDDLHQVYDSGEATNERVSNIRSYAFDLVGRQYRMSDGDPVAVGAGAANNVEVLDRAHLPKCMNDETRPFIVRNFTCVQRKNHLLHVCDLVLQRTTELSLVVGTRAIIRCFDVHPSRPTVIVGGCDDGLLFIYDLDRGEMAQYRRVPNGWSIRFVKFVGEGLEVLVSIEPNELLVVDSVLLMPVNRPLHPNWRGEEDEANWRVDSNTSLTKPANQKRPQQSLAERKACLAVMAATWTLGCEVVAYVENNNTVVLLCRQRQAALTLLGKHYSHVDRVQSMRFAGVNDEKLLTFADDRHMTEYDVWQSIQQGKMVPVRRVQYDQSARVTASLECLKDADPRYDLLTFDDELKVKFWHSRTLPIILRTAVGPTLDGERVRSAVHIPKVTSAAAAAAANTTAGAAAAGPSAAGGEPDDADYVAFATAGQSLGLHRLPFDGNGFRNVCQLAHPNGIRQMHALANGRQLLTLGWDDHAFFVWTIQRRVVNECMLRGGSGLMPFCRALPDSRDGWLFREMQDLYYYMQILKRSVDCPEEQVVSDTLVIAEVPDYLRGLGLFLSEFEAHNVFVELSDNQLHAIGHLKVTFSDLVRVYVNHRPVNGYPFADVERSLRTFTGPGSRKLAMLDRDRLMDMCTKMGEFMPKLEAAKVLVALMSTGDGPRVLGSTKATFSRGADEGGAASERVTVENDNDDEKLVASKLEELPEMFDMQDFLDLVLGLETTKPPQTDSDPWKFRYECVNDPGEDHPVLCNSNEQKLRWGPTELNNPESEANK